jgi:DNA-directed RNA polymerase beta subunit
MLYDNEDTNLSNRLTLLGEYKISSKHKDLEDNGRSILFALDMAYDIDIYFKKYMKTDSILKELLLTIANGPMSDQNINKKYLRFKEYIMAVLIKNLYNMICGLHDNRKIKFKISPTIILDSCILSDIVRFNYTFNPISEISSLLQCTLTGPGGFKKESVPDHLKDLDNSYKGFFCSADTPDRDGCGVVLNIPPGTEIDVNGGFSKPSSINCSYPITQIPFVKNDDPTRLQMSSSQQKQTIILEDSDHPFIKTNNADAYLKYSTYYNVAKYDGKVIYKDDLCLIVKYDNDEKLFESKKREKLFWIIILEQAVLLC